MSALPAGLRAAIATLAGGHRLADLKQQHGAVSDHYRAGGTSSGVIDSEAAVAAYALARLPATYAACAAALNELDAAWQGPDLTSALDIGCGPGTALLAALEAFPTLRRAAGIDHNPRFLRLASRLIAEAGYAAGREIHTQSGDLHHALIADPADLVLASYALVELEEAAATSAVLRAWTLTRHVLVLVEPGSQSGFARLRAARSALIAEGATILAPCTHDAACPMREGDWCHVSVRLPRSREHQALKGASVPFEDEKFTYLVAARSGTPRHAMRIIAPVHHAKSGHRVTTCDRSGIQERIISPRDADFKPAKKWEWGDGV